MTDRSTFSPDGVSDDPGAMPQQGTFLAENMHGDWLVVRRFDPGKLRDFATNAVINGRQGIWWHPKRWRLIDAASPAAAREDVAR